MRTHIKFLTFRDTSTRQSALQGEIVTRWLLSSFVNDLHVYLSDEDGVQTSLS